MSKILSTLIIIILFGLSVFLFITYYNQITAEEKQLFVTSSQEELPNNISNTLSMFMDNIRFNTNNLSYSFVDCDEFGVSRMTQAFNIVSDETKIVSFYEDINSPKIVIYCSEKMGEQRNNSFVAGEGGPDKVILLDLYPLIINGKIYLYKRESKENCEDPIVELHELMHVFGFDHINKSNEILYPYVNCEQKFTKDISDELIRIYSEKPKADLLLKNLTASIQGKYMNFEVTVLNRGLLPTQNISLEINALGKTIKTFPIEGLSPGISQTLTVKNFLLPSTKITEIELTVNSETQEYFYENNKIVAKLQ